eukprot:6466850-Amphidinium_carterae.1
MLGQCHTSGSDLQPKRPLCFFLHLRHLGSSLRLQGRPLVSAAVMVAWMAIAAAAAARVVQWASAAVRKGVCCSRSTLSSFCRVCRSCLLLSKASGLDSQAGQLYDFRHPKEAHSYMSSEPRS